MGDLLRAKILLKITTFLKGARVKVQGGVSRMGDLLRAKIFDKNQWSPIDYLIDLKHRPEWGMLYYISSTL